MMAKVFTKDLGHCIMPCWTRSKRTGEIEIRLWGGDYWLEFGCDAPVGKEEIERLSEPLEYDDWRGWCDLFGNVGTDR